MKRLLLTAIAGFSVLFAFSQQITGNGQIRPVKYEKIDGKLQVISYVKLDSPMPEGALFKLDGKEIETLGGGADSIVVRLPMIGKFNRLSLVAGNKVLSETMVKAPIDSDWGYFGKGMIHVMQSSHQDIAWMDTPQYCRNERIEDIVKPALETMKQESRYAFEMEQTLNLMEFLERYPDRKEEIIQRYKEGRFTWGGSFTQPYEGLLSGEQLVRQIYYGRKWIKDSLGCDERTVYNIDVPGRAMQVPQIYRKSGIHSLFISRMYDGLYDWYSPDGTKLPTFACTKYDYPTGVLKYFHEDAFTAMERIYGNIMLAGPDYAEYGIPAHYPIVISTDASKPINLLPLIDEWNHIADISGENIPHISLTTADKFLEAVEEPGIPFKRVDGERPNLWLYIHGTAHHKMYADKRRAAVTLPAAETMSSIAETLLQDFCYPARDFFRGWMASIYPDHGIGGKNGTITDSIFADSLHVAKTIGDKTLSSALSSMTKEIAADKGSIVVFNDLTWNRRDIVRYPVDKAVSVEGVPSQMSNGQVCFIADVPSFGYNSYKISKKPAVGGIPDGIEQGENFYDGHFYKFVLGKGGIISLFDKELGRELVVNDKYAMGDIISLEYKGNGAGEFTQIKEPERYITYRITRNKGLTGDFESVWKITETGPVFTVFECTTPMDHATVIQKITAYHAIKKIDIDIRLKDFDGSHNRQYRILFPMDNEWRKSCIDYEVPYGVARVGRDEMKDVANGFCCWGTYDNRPSDTHPREIQNFISASGNGFGFTLASDVNTADWMDPSLNREFYTVLQAIILSSHHSCHGEGDWYSQEGTHDFHFSILSHKEGWENGYCYAVASNHPYSVCTKTNSGGHLEKNGSLLSVSDPLVSVSTLKKADDGTGYILRIVEMEGKDKEVTITLPFNVSKVIKTNLIEEEEGPQEGSGNKLTFKIGHHAVEAYKLVVL